MLHFSSVNSKISLQKNPRMSGYLSCTNAQSIQPGQNEGIFEKSYNADLMRTTIKHSLNNMNIEAMTKDLISNKALHYK